MKDITNISKENFVKVLQNIVDKVPLALNLWDAQMNNIACNKQVLTMFGIDDEEQYLRNFHKFSPQMQPNGISSAEMFKRNMAILEKDGYHQFKWLHLDNDGLELPAEITLNKLNIIDDQSFIVGFVRDLRPEFKKIETTDDDFYFRNRVPEKAFLSKLAEIAEDLYFAIDTRTATIQFLGKGLQKFSGKDYGSITVPFKYDESNVHEEDINLYQELAYNMNNGIVKPQDLRIIQADGTFRYYRIIYDFIYNNQKQPLVIIGRAHDVHQQRLLEKQAKFDALTKCYSKMDTEAIISEKLTKAGEYDSALLLLDIVNFKAFNEQYGHFYGDEILRQLAGRLNSWVYEKDIIGRVGGDEFIIYINKLKDQEQFNAKVEEFINYIHAPYDLPHTSVEIIIKMGVVVCNNRQLSYDYYRQCADKALFKAKISDKSWFYFDEQQNDDSALLLSKAAKAGKISGLNMDHAITASIFNILYERNSDHTAINAALRYLGQSYNACRCLIGESFDNGQTYSFTYEWCREGIEPHPHKDVNFPASYIDDLLNSCSVNGVYSCPDITSCTLEKRVLDIISSYKTKAFVHSQVKKDDAVTFFIGIEDCQNIRQWTDVEMNTLNYMTRVFSIILQGKHLHEEVAILSAYNKISAFVGDNTDNFIYIVDPETYDIIHMNKKALGMYGSPDESVWRNSKCYALLHEKTEPCEFCTNQYTTEHEFYEWTYYNPRFNKSYLFKDKLVHLNGKMVKLQVATDITKMVNLEEEVKNKLEEQTLLLDCIKMLHTDATPVASIEEILNIVCRFYNATRGVVLQISEDRQYVNNTHEWTNDNMQPFKHQLQNMPISLLNPFMEMLKDKSVAYLDDVQGFFADNQLIMPLLQERDAKHIICASILDNKGEFVGMFAVDNPQANIDKYWLLSSLAGFIADFLEKNRLIDSLNQLSYYDSLTKVKNRQSYRRALLEIDESHVLSLGVAYVDIAGLSKINEEQGTRYGDEMLKKMAHMLTTVFGDDIFRVGGDEFVVLEQNVEEMVFEAKITKLKQIIEQEPDLNAAIGFTWNTNITDEDIQDFEQFNTIRASLNYTAILSKNLAHEIKSGKYVVYLQPQISFKTNRLDGVEALIRRIDAHGNIQSPASFVPFYEKEGMIAQIDLYVLETVCQLLQKWQDVDCAKNLQLSVNCSRSTIMGKNIVAKLSQICEKYAVEKSKIIIEITETISHADDLVFSQIISSLKNAGFCVSLDDFGTGYSNLTSLQGSDFDEIKIDMQLTKTVHTDQKSKILTKVALNLCNDLPNMVSVAEGIETVEQFEVLKNLNCHKGQGYYLSRPISITDFEDKYFRQE